MAIKVLISGYENTGKTTLISKIDDALIVNCDAKEFSIPKLHTNFNEYNGLNSFIEFMNEKIKLYKSKFKKLPKYIVIDTITHLYSKMVKWNMTQYKGFEIHNANNRETLELNDYIEKVLLKNGMNTVIVAHTKIDDKTGKHVIPAQGNFRDCGSFLSVCNEALFIERGLDLHKVWIKSDMFPVRSLIKSDVDSYEFNEFDINSYLQKISDVKTETEKFKL